MGKRRANNVWSILFVGKDGGLSDLFGALRCCMFFRAAIPVNKDGRDRQTDLLGEYVAEDKVKVRHELFHEV